MPHIILWFYIISLLISFASFFSSVLIYSCKKSVWQKYFLDVLGILLLLLVGYTLFYFIFLYTEAGREYIKIFQLLYTTVLTSLLIYKSLKLVLCTLSTAGYKKVLNIMLIILIISSLLSLFIYKVLLPVLYIVYLLLFGLILILSVINVKTILEEKGRGIIFILPVAALLLFPLEYLEYYLRKQWVTEFSYIPTGLLIFAIYCLAVNSFNLLYTITHVRRSGLVESKSEDMSDSYIKKFKVTTREKEIITYLIKGLSHKQIAVECDISVRTVNRHIYNIYRKCSVNSAVELINIINKYKYS